MRGSSILNSVRHYLIVRDVDLMRGSSPAGDGGLPAEGP